MTTSTALTLEIVCEEFKPRVTSTLRGFAALTFPIIGLRLLECTFHVNVDGKKWVGLPARSYELSGQKKWAQIAESTDKHAHFRFQAAAVQAVEKFLAAHK